MTMVTITLQLPEELIIEAQEFNLLTPEKITALLREEVDRCVMELVNAEIQAYRREKALRQQPKPSETS